ncbi:MULTISPECIES: heavy metal translocating P-type ATPase [unclassified Helicobacter]|uniref:heavy metal translocating P-type ATPase n=1 Tax=unclassified Helicobacter TaxID=2593540 RepID=UPI000CF038FE|nr:MULTISPECIES: heavy metal translocating P-type ATPase [unclassified Helicobacter]
MRACSHCQNLYKEEMLKKVIHNDNELFFCCNGCEGVYFLLHQNNLNSFYDKLSHQSLTPPKIQIDETLNFFDTPSFSQRYIYKDSQGFDRFALVLEGIHCTACVWLIEKMLEKQEGIFEVSLNYTNNKIQVSFNKDKIKPSEIVRIIRKLGYDANVYDPNLSEQRFQDQNKKYYIAMIVAIFCTMNIMWIAVAQYAGYFSDISQTMKNVLNFASFLLATPVLLWTGRFFYLNAFNQLKNKIIGMDLLVSVGAVLTYCYSIYVSITQSGETYFEAVSMIITFVFIGKFLEVKVKKDAGNNLDKLTFILPTQVNVIKNKKRIALSPQEVQVDDVIEVLPNEVIPIDGILLSDEALLDMQNISGESLPVLKNRGDEILSGSINTQKILRYRAQKCFSDSLLFRLVDILEHSLSQKPQIQNLANKLSRYFSNVVLLIAVCGFLVWYFLLHSSFEQALMIGISVIVISCPCALALATPIASVVGITESYKQKIILKEVKFLETIAKATHLFFDKTGTLTLGRPQVKHFLKIQDFDTKLLVALLSYTKHPIAEGIKEYFSQEDIPVLDQVQEILGRGIIGFSDGRELIGGSLLFLKEKGVEIGDFDLKNFTNFGFALDKKLCAIFLLEDSLKEDAKPIIESIRHQFPNIALLSGDNERSVASIAKSLGIDKYYSNLLPMQKADFVQKYQDQGIITIMVGDGINDSLALSKSSIGIAFNTQNSIASLASDVIILDQSLTSLNKIFRISHKTYRIIKQNIVLSIIYNILMIPLALCGFIIPLFAALSMSFSSLLVIGNSFRIKKWNK